LCRADCALGAVQAGNLRLAKWGSGAVCRLGKNFLSCCSIGRVRSCVRPVDAADVPLAQKINLLAQNLKHDTSARNISLPVLIMPMPKKCQKQINTTGVQAGAIAQILIACLAPRGDRGRGDLVSRQRRRLWWFWHRRDALARKQGNLPARTCLPLLAHLPARHGLERVASGVTSRFCGLA
jgi:hypothetical protein